MKRKNMVDYYSITYCAMWPDGELFNHSRPFMTANILASSEDEAIAKLKENFRMCKIELHSKPVKHTLSNAQYCQ